MLQFRWVDNQLGKNLVILYVEANNKWGIGEFYTLAFLVSLAVIWRWWSALLPAENTKLGRPADMLEGRGT